MPPWLAVSFLAAILLYTIVGAVYWSFAKKPSAVAYVLTALPLIALAILILWPR